MALAAAALAVFAGAAVGCGDDGGSTPARDPATKASVEAGDIRSPRDLFVTAADVKKAGPDTPAGVLLKWWQALQFEDEQTARDAYAGSVDLRGFRADVRVLQPNITSSRPYVADSVGEGDEMRLYVFFRGASFPAGRPPQVTEAPASFRMVREGSGWKLGDNDFLARRARAQRAAEKAARKSASKG
jgi:hypothetical protein